MIINYEQLKKFGLFLSIMNNFYVAKWSQLLPLVPIKN